MESLCGKLLLASPRLVDPNFFRTVILIGEHSEGGALGVVLNQPATAEVGDAVPDLEWLTNATDPLYIGGPVAPDSVIVLAEFDRGAPQFAAGLIVDNIGFIGANAEESKDQVAVATNATRVFAGHAGWMPGQLEEEIEDLSWIVQPPRPGEIFTAEPEKLWSSVLRRMGGEFALLSTMPIDPSQN
jgi:putative transcriptional regulator